MQDWPPSMYSTAAWAPRGAEGNTSSGTASARRGKLGLGEPATRTSIIAPRRNAFARISCDDRKRKRLRAPGGSISDQAPGSRSREGSALLSWQASRLDKRHLLTLS